jgi:hypothetical protein
VNSLLEYRSGSHATEEKGRVGRPADLERWYVEEHIPGRSHATREEDLAAARERFGPWTKDWLDLRALRKEHAPDEWRKPGPRSDME